jgi:hypothetical protein
VVTISKAIPTGITVAALSGGGDALSIPGSVIIPAGAATATFVANASGLFAESFVITASTNGSSESSLVSVVPSALFAIQGNPSEVLGESNGSIVTATIAPAGFTGSVVAKGAGSVNFAPDSSGNGVFFLNCCASTNNANYRFTGAALGEIFNQTQGQIAFSLQSRHTNAQRATANSYRSVFDVRDNNAANHVFYFLTQNTGGRLVFSYAVDGGAQQSYYVPKGTEDTLFGAGVELTAAIVWESGTVKLYLNGTLAQTGNYTAVTPNWSATSNFDLGATEVLTLGSSNSCDDIIRDFTVGPIVQR